MWSDKLYHAKEQAILWPLVRMYALSGFQIFPAPPTRTYYANGKISPPYMPLSARYRAFLFGSDRFVVLQKHLTVYLLRYINNTIKEIAQRSQTIILLLYLDLIICPYNVCLRLTQCQTTKGNLSILLNAKWQWAQDTERYNNSTYRVVCLPIFWIYWAVMGWIIWQNWPWRNEVI